MRATLKKVKDYLNSSIKYLTTPSEWVKSYELAKEFFPHLKTLILDDIDIDKITKFVSKNRKEEQVYKIITIIALINGAIAFVPGQMGIGVAICRALEGYMAYEIAKTVGIKFELKNFYKLIIATGITTVSVFWLMKTFLSFAFSFTGGVFVAAEILATNFLGLFFWLSFEEINKFDTIKSLSIVKTLSIATRAVRHSINLVKAQIKVIGDIGSKLKKLSQNIWAIITFKKNQEQIIKGDLLFALCLARLLENKEETFEGFFGSKYLDAWRMSYTKQLGSDATFEDIAKFVQSYDKEQLVGLQKPVQGKLFEILENAHENSDSDEYKSEIFETPNHPMVDIKKTDILSGKSYGIQLKASENINYIEDTLRKYPDTPIIVPKGVAEKVNHPLVMDGNYTMNELTEINETNFDKLLDVHHGEYLAKGGVEAGILVLAMNLMPFIYARHQRQINNEQFTRALKKFIPELTAKTIHRVTLLSLIGPLYAFFLISKAIGKTLLEGIDEEELVLDEEEQSDFNKKNISRREFFLLFSPKNI
ncbi:hypothetical protein [Candidatus Pelagibacter communis]|uniref:hypothetical protein n=1 Tax=Pelagibacter ubique TaxID=198252 RepID=UPI00065B3A46|nr:hypothetical protein [Candidatus Pelagibacter ubique]